MIIKGTGPYRREMDPMPGGLARGVAVLFMVFALTLTQWTLQGFMADPDFSSLAYADKDKDNDDDDKDKDGDEEESDTDIGIKGHEAHVMVKGITGKVKVETEGGNIDLLLTSSDVKAKSDSGDIFADGLTQKGKIETKSGQVKVRYCRSPDSSGEDLKIKSKTDGGFVDVQLPDDSEFKLKTELDNDTHLLVQPVSMECSSCGYKIKIKAKDAASVTVVGYELGDATDTCQY